MRIGILGLQGAVREHERSLSRLGMGIESRIVKRAAELSGIDGLILPGGESTTMSLLANGVLIECLRGMADEGFPMFGTCAGMILLANEVDGRPSEFIRAIDIAVERNASGRQVDSFEATLDVEGIGDDVPAVFIRAPYAIRSGPAVTPMARHNGSIVMARERNVLACSFHPELTDDVRTHRYFVKMIEARFTGKET
jgi:5'-phosphate synthase pdxT subunit